jgi:uncharacterized protein (TIGR03435 family)
MALSLQLMAGPCSQIRLYAQADAQPQALQTAGSRPEFDVASVKQNKTNGPRRSNFPLDSGNVYSTVGADDVRNPTGSYLSATNQPLWRYIVFAYKLSGTQELALRFNYFSGVADSKVPAWVSGGFDSAADGYDIEARAPGIVTKDQMRLMMQSLLADRFKLAVHMETREAPVFALVLVRPGQTGPQLKPHAKDDPCTGAAQSSAAAGQLPAACGVIARLQPSVPGRYSIGGRGVTLDLLASSLPTQTGLATISKPVIDRTGLTGTFDFSMEWAPEVNAGAPAGAPQQAEVPGPPFAEALKQQLGLKLVAQKGPIEVLVIDHVERPSAN